jgi:hypothetical protein
MVETESKGRQLHALAEHAREAGDFLGALKFTDEAMIAYQEAGDFLGFAEILASRFLTLRHLAEKTGDVNYQVLAKFTVMASVEIAKKLGDPKALILPMFNLAKVQEDLGEFVGAVRSYQETVQMASNLPERHNRPGVVADMRIHLATCEYKAGDKSGLERALVALDNLEKSDEPDYNKHVWLSGGHMRIAEMIYGENQPLAVEHLRRAKEIIDADERLKLRLGQWQKLIERLGVTGI